MTCNQVIGADLIQTDGYPGRVCVWGGGAFGPQLDKKNRKTRLMVTKAPAMNIQAASLLCGPNQTHLSALFSPEQAGAPAETEAARSPPRSRKVNYDITAPLRTVSRQVRLTSTSRNLGFPLTGVTVLPWLPWLHLPGGRRALS